MEATTGQERGVLAAIEQGWLAASGLELLAMLASLAYTLLAIRERRVSWLFGGLGAVLYAIVFWQAQLVFQTALQGFYLLLSALGWWQWGRQGERQAAHIHSWPWGWHLGAAALLLVLAVLLGGWLGSWTQAALPRLDALVSFGAVWATVLLTRKVREAWLWLLVLNLLALWLFAVQGLWFTVLLFALYVVLAAAGWWAWRERPATGAVAGASAP